MLFGQFCLIWISSCTLNGYYDIWATHQENCGNSEFRKFLNYCNWKESWYNFLRLLDIDLKENSQCTKCGVVPKEIVCDATSLGHQKKFASIALTKDTSTPFPKMS